MTHPFPRTLQSTLQLPKLSLLQELTKESLKTIRSSCYIAVGLQGANPILHCLSAIPESVAAASRLAMLGMYFKLKRQRK